MVVETRIISWQHEMKISCEKENYENWKFFKGTYTFKVLDKIGKGVDCIFLDTDHNLPGEILDFLMIYPLIDDQCTIFIHDINLPLIRPKTEYLSISPRLLFSSIPGPKDEIENLGVVFTKKKYIEPLSILGLLISPWKNLDIFNEKELIGFFDKYYSKKFTSFYNEIIKFQFSCELQKCKLIGK